MNIVMMGTGTFAEPTFEALLKAFPGEVVGLVTQPPREIGRRSGSSRQTGVGMATIAQSHSIPVVQPESINSEEGLTQLAALNPDLLVVAAYGQILKPSVLAIPKLGAINVHASLLPKYRGAAPVAHAILKGETETGVTIIRITPGLDAGDMLAQDDTSIGENETTGELESRLATIGAKLCIDVVSRLKAGTITGTKQDLAQVTNAPKITKEMGLIDWKNGSINIRNHIRAMQPWPTAYTFFHRNGFETLRIIIQQVNARSYDVTGSTKTNTPGLIIYTSAAENIVIVESVHHDFVDIHQLQIAGKKPITAAEFIRGYPLPEGSRFGPEHL